MFFFTGGAGFFCDAKWKICDIFDRPPRRHGPSRSPGGPSPIPHPGNSVFSPSAVPFPSPSEVFAPALTGGAP